VRGVAAALSLRVHRCQSHYFSATPCTAVYCCISQHQVNTKFIIFRYNSDMRTLLHRPTPNTTNYSNTTCYYMVFNSASSDWRENIELDSMCKEAFLPQISIPFRHFLKPAGINHDRSQDNRFPGRDSNLPNTIQKGFGFNELVGSHKIITFTLILLLEPLSIKFRDRACEIYGVLLRALIFPNIFLSRDIKSVSELYGQRMHFKIK
jgi:hypothetical protein